MSTPHLSRRAFMGAMGLLGVQALLSRPARAAGPPNFLVILVDDLGYGDLACYGAKDMRTPHIDRLVSEGMHFNQFYANCPVCSPTRAALLSGTYPDLVGVPGVIRTHPEDSWGYLDPEATLLPAALKASGYHTALVGKWHLGLEAPNLPGLRGFDHVHGFMGDMMDDYYTHLRHGNNYMRRDGVEVDPEGHATDLFSAWARDYLDQRKGAEDPFFLYLAYNAPHTPIQPPKDWLQRVLDREAGIDPDRAGIVALIEHLDDGIGRVLKRLRDNGQQEDTLVIFVSDNGGYLRRKASNGNLRDGKEDMYEGGIRVPACAVWPDHIPAGSVSNHLGMTMDLYPTLCEIAGAPVPDGIAGRSLWAAFQDPDLAHDPERILIWVRREGNARYGGRDYYAVRRGDWKLVQNSPFAPYELYNLADDPLESSPLPEGHPEFRPLFNALMAHVQKAGRIPWQAPH